MVGKRGKGKKRPIMPFDFCFFPSAVFLALVLNIVSRSARVSFCGAFFSRQFYAWFRYRLRRTRKGECSRHFRVPFFVPFFTFSSSFFFSFPTEKPSSSFFSPLTRICSRDKKVGGTKCVPRFRKFHFFSPNFSRGPIPKLTTLGTLNILSAI